MLQKLTTRKHVISSSDITKDRNTGQVKISLEGKKRTDTGGLSGTLTVAENAFVRLTSNIDVADGLANGVRGIIKSIITNNEQSVTAILVQFDDKNVGKQAKSSSQYKSQYPAAVPIYRHGVPFQCNRKSLNGTQKHYNIPQSISTCTGLGKYYPLSPRSHC